MVPLTVPLAFLCLQLRTDAEKRSLVESGLSWYSEDGKASHKLSSCSYDTGSLKTDAPSKWRKKPPSLSEDSGGKGELKKPQSLGQPGSFKKGRNPPVGVTSPITHTSQSTLKVAGDTYCIFSLVYLFFSQPVRFPSYRNYDVYLQGSGDMIRVMKPGSRINLLRYFETLKARTHHMHQI